MREPNCLDHVDFNIFYKKVKNGIMDLHAKQAAKDSMDYKCAMLEQLIYWQHHQFRATCAVGDLLQKIEKKLNDDSPNS